MMKRLTIYILAISFLIGCSASMKSNMKDAMSMNHESCCCNSDSKSCTMKKNHSSNSMVNSDIDSSNSLPQTGKLNKKMSCCAGNHNQSKEEKNCKMCMNHSKNGHSNLFGKLDSNKDEKITISEFLKRPNQKFDSLDKNSDGFLTRDELAHGKENSKHAHH